MISEPELVGGDGDVPIPPSYGPVPPAEPDAAGDPGRRPGHGRRARRSWLWALGGAVAASALWAGGLYAYQAKGPDLRGYHTPRQLCDEARLTALSGEYGERGETTQGMREVHEALDQVQCSVSLGTDESTVGVDLTYALHKKMDPGPEFEALETARAWDDWDWKPLPGLGERAFFAQDDAGFAGLKVLDGQAVLTLFVSAQTDYDPVAEEGAPAPVPAPATTAGLRNLMVEDMKALMTALRS
ncbi:hypothetical protein ACF068_02465 [Streptomyces sp. NPDC016309]|uniref:hypothetical protein n=1 Tax=Streptomyces sp. NPDC016309 TaxID=3364965 RepID=UPI0036F9D622